MNDILRPVAYMHPIAEHCVSADPTAYSNPRLLYELQWISVKDRLPRKHTEVLIAFAGQVSLASTGQWTDSPNDRNGWCYPVENNGACHDGSDPVVTHWMPLPEVPGTV